ncbi:MAG: hypothetical protein ACM30E_03120 [Nitrososphaerales archaeon]
MHKPLTVAARALALLFIAAMLFMVALPSLFIASLDSTSFASGPGGHGCKEGNLIPNCGFDQFAPVAQGEAPAGWMPYLLSGSLAMTSSPDTYWGAPSFRMWSDGGTFVAGIYTQVGGLTPGASYSASVGWGAPDPWQGDNFGRRLGIDPTGGTDPNSPNIVWGPEWRGPGKVLNDSNPGMPNIDVSAVARSSTLTVFVKVDHNYSTGQDEIFIDAVGLYQDSAPVVAVPTNTPPPPAAAPQAAPAPTKAKAAAPAKRPPTATVAPTATATSTTPPTATPAPTDTPAPTSTPTVTPTPEDTATPTLTPSSALPPRPRATVAPATTQVASRTAGPQVLLFGGIGALAGAGLLSIGAFVRRRK